MLVVVAVINAGAVFARPAAADSRPSLPIGWIERFAGPRIEGADALTLDLLSLSLAGLGSASLTASGNACVNNQYWDLAATQMGMIGIQPGNTYGTTSPALNTVGNSNSIITG